MPGIWSLYATGLTFVRGASCRVDNFPNVVMLSLITANPLRQGGSRAGFSVTIQRNPGHGRAPVCRHSQPKMFR
ncbi:MAG: hypothetical protein ACSLEN_07575 [Candidatus Malihini olakiniferum]